LITITQTKEGILLPVRVTPRGGQDCLIAYEEGDAWVKARISCPPEDGKANKALISLMADILSIPQREITVTSGATSRMKRLAIETQEISQLLTHLSQKLETTNEECFRLLSL
jgi:uncharacterized protein